MRVQPSPPRNRLCTAPCCLNHPAGSLLASQAWQDFSNLLLLPGAVGSLARGAWEPSRTLQIAVHRNYTEAAGLNVPR